MATYKGKFKPVNWKKYKGNVDNITYRSSWELSAFKVFDDNTNIVKWSSEDHKCIVPYYNPIKKRNARYFCDAWTKVKQSDGTYKEFLVEIKPLKETVAPKPPRTNNRKAQQRFEYQKATWIVNSAKWDAARKYCKKHNMEFIYLTEQDLVRGKKK